MKNISFFALTAFSQTGGIEKFNRCLIKVLNELPAKGIANTDNHILYDTEPDIRYVSTERFKGYRGSKFRFVSRAIFRAKQSATVIVGHLNLALLVVGIKTIYPKKKIILILHGIEVMEPVKGLKKKALQCCDEIWVVSHFTQRNVVQIQGISPAKIKVLFNTIDPFFVLPPHFEKPGYLQNRYGAGKKDPVLFTLTRLKEAEGYKGYDKVIAALPEVLKVFPTVKYILAGKGDAGEIEKVQRLISQHQLDQQVLLTGFIPDSEVTDHYLLADLFVMPSKKEGFGIVFIEALACGLPVIAGNQDGSVDALQNGRLGTLVDPDDVKAIAAAIIRVLQQTIPVSTQEKRQQVQQDVFAAFGFDRFAERIEEEVELLIR